VFTEQELSIIRDLCVKYDVVAITDEIYEHLVFDGLRHIPIATYPGMQDRTITICGLGKTVCRDRMASGVFHCERRTDRRVAQGS
jgi:aspartate/methionine/tyrosine aminotransferase